jgi:hypothetical protein
MVARQGKFMQSLAQEQQIAVRKILIIQPSRWWSNDKSLRPRGFALYVVSSSSPVIAHMMVTGGLHGR